MSEDPEEHVADGFHLLVATIQQNELKDFEKAYEDERYAALELRQAQGAGLSASQLLQDMLGEDDVKRQTKLDMQFEREQQARDAAAALEKKENELPADRFPEPVLTI